VIIGPTLFDIPLEEVFFFVIQTYNTSLLYLLLNKTTLHSIYLRAERPSTHLGGPLNAKWIYYRRGGQLALGFTLLTAFYLNNAGGRGTYMSLVIGWVVPFLLLLWQVNQVALRFEKG
jgi:15-cis-phytoene synthase/lycopene beta-cyclase